MHVDEAYSALANNIGAITSVAASVERTLGPKGLDTMLVDQFGDVLVTNSGVTILERIDVSHPAARMLLQVAKAQHRQVGDGTTTATVMAAAILSEGLNQIMRGVPVSRLLEGLRQAADRAVRIINEKIARPVKNLDDPILLDVARIAGRGDNETAKLVVLAAKTVGEERLKQKGFKLAGIVLAEEGAKDELVRGLIFAKSKVSPLMPDEISDAKILIIEDSLMPETIEEEALHTELGFQKNLELKNRFIENLQKIPSLDVNAVFLEGGISAEAEELLTLSGILAVRRLGGIDLENLSAFTGARPLKRNGLNRPLEELGQFIGKAKSIECGQTIRISGGGGQARATLQVGASTKQVTDEKERKTQDAAASLQAAFLHGIVPGGGATELAIGRHLESERAGFKSMTSYGLDCMIEGLKKPFLQMAANAGFNSLEKAEAAQNEQANQNKNSISIDFESGVTADMYEHHIIDSADVKIHAIESAVEVAEAILRINRIIKMKEAEAGANGRI